MSKYYLTYKKEEKNVKIDLTKMLDLSNNEIMSLAKEIDVDLSKIIVIKQTLVKRIIEEIEISKKYQKININEKLEGLNTDQKLKVIKEIQCNLSKFKCYKEFEMNKIKSIDYITTMFNTTGELLLFLKKVNLIDENVYDLTIMVENKTKDNVIMEEFIYPYKIFLKKHTKTLTYHYVETYIKERSMNKEFIGKLMKYYKSKYKSKRLYLYEMCKSINTLCDMYEKLSIGEKNEYKDLLDDFIKSEFEKTIKNQKVDNEKNIHEFICYINGETRHYKKTNEENVSYTFITKKYEDNTEYDEHEEFLTEEDYKDMNDEFFSKTHRIRSEIITDGKDFTKTSTNSELRKEWELMQRQELNERKRSR